MQSKFGEYLRKLRKTKGLTLKQVEAAAAVSNAYISQIERGLRNPPHPDILKRLAKLYDVTPRHLLIAAGYLEDPEEQIRREKIERAFEHVMTDPQYKHGTRLKGGHLGLDAKRFIIEMYEKSTNRKLLE